MLGVRRQPTIRVRSCASRASSPLSEAGEIRAQGIAISLADRDDDPQLFEILIECFPSQIDLARFEESAHISFEFRCGKVTDPATKSTHPLLGKQLVHLFPVRFHKIPSQL